MELFEATRCSLPNVKMEHQLEFSMSQPSLRGGNVAYIKNNKAKINHQRRIPTLIEQLEYQSRILDLQLKGKNMI